MSEIGLETVYNKNTKIMILGTFPSIKSRRICYYNNPQNQFWRIMAEILQQPQLIQGTTETRYPILLSHYIGLWDVVNSCDFIKRSSMDSSIRNPIYNDFSILQEKCPCLEKIVFNSNSSKNFFIKYLRTIKNQEKLVKELLQLTNDNNNILPSTSPANAAVSYSEKLKKWSDFFQDIF